MVKKKKKHDYDLEMLEAKFEIAQLNWERAKETKEIIDKTKKECIT